MFALRSTLRIVGNSRTLRSMSTHKFDDPKIQEQFDDIKARREQIFKREAEDVFVAYLNQLATHTEGSWYVDIKDNGPVEKGPADINAILSILQQKDKGITVKHWWGYWIFERRT